jgi:type III pantothenate kinase
VLVAIDARNRAITIGFRLGGAWLLRRRIASAPPRSADEYALLMRAFLAEAVAADATRAAGEARIEAVWMSSVVPSLARELRAAALSAFGATCVSVGPGIRTGVKIRTEVPSEVGSDLVCAAAAARELVRGACVIVDFDAAIAFSAIGSEGDFLGAAIAPGVDTALESLRASAALLPEVRMDGPVAAIGKNTPQAIRSGIGIGYQSLVDGVARRQADELVALGEADSPGTVALLGTGGEEGRAILAAIGRGRFVPDLVLEGLAIIAARNMGAPAIVA